MKYTVTIILSLFSIYSVFQNRQMNGVYKIEFKNKNMQSDGYITFDGNSFQARPNRYLPYNGKVMFGANSTLLKSKFQSNLIIEFNTNEIDKDTISFQVHDSDMEGSYLHFSVNNGKLIKVK